MSELSTVTSLLVVGTGSAGARHIVNAAAAGVADVAAFRSGIERLPLPKGVRVETDLNAALARKPDGVVIANETSRHINSALTAAQAGCHLLIEKPLSDALAGIEDLRRQVEDRSLAAMVGYQFRFHPLLCQVRSWLWEGEIGEIVTANVVWGEYLPGWQPWRDYRTSYAAQSKLGGGVLLTLSHPIDYLRWLLGEVVCVNAMTARRSDLEIDVEDIALVHLRFESGAIASLSVDYIRRPPQHNFTITGTEGVIRWDNNRGVAVLEAGGNTKGLRVPSGFERNDMFAAEMNHFLRCAAGMDEPVCSLDDGERTLRVCIAAKEAALSGRKIDV